MGTCNKCALADTCMTVRLEPKGPAKVDILIVCDFPGNEEDFQGLGFVGPTQTLLEDMVSAAGLTAFRVGYTYALRCKPPIGNKPLPAFVDACREYLRDEIYERQPRVILALGDYALRACTKLSGVKDKRGKEITLHADAYRRNDSDERPTVFATYSAAFVRRAPHARNTVVSDLRRAGNYINKQTSDTGAVEWSWWDGEEIHGDVLAYDIEAVDENGEYTDYPTQIAITGDNGTFVSLDCGAIGSLLVGRRTVGHNSWGYDVDVLRKFGVKVEKDYDTMVLAYYVDELQPLGLEALAVKYLGVPGWKEAFSSKLGSDEFAYYNARDTRYTLELFNLFRKELGPRLYLVESLILSARNCLDKITERGIYIDREAVLVTKKTSEETIHATKEKIARIVGEEDFNPGSSTQVGQYLTDQGFELPLTETGKPQTSASVLQSITDSVFVDELQKFREAKKTLSTYVKPYLALSSDGDGRAHPTFQLVRTRTGRTSSKNPNSQNLTRELKHFFGASPGNVLVTVDYSSIQFRIAAWFANEKTILASYSDNAEWDAHKFFGAMFYDTVEELITKEQRQVAKSANFSQLFMGNENTIQEYAKRTMGLEIPMQTCWEIHQAWHRAFPGFYSFYARTREEILETGQVVCPTGHIRHFGDPKLFDTYTFRNALREGVNVLVQNLEAHIVFLAMRELDRLNMPMVNMVHDSLSFEFCKEDYTEGTKKTICDIMTQYPIKALKEGFSVNFDVPILVEVETREY